MPDGSDTRLNRAQHHACYVRETEYTHIYIYNTNIHNTPVCMFIYVYVYIYTHICALHVCSSREGHAAQPRNDMLHTRARVNMNVATLERHRLQLFEHLCLLAYLLILYAVFCVEGLH